MGPLHPMPSLASYGTASASPSPRRARHGEDLLHCLRQVREAEATLALARSSLAELAANGELSINTLTSLPASAVSSTCNGVALPVAPPAAAPPVPPPRLPSMHSTPSHGETKHHHGCHVSHAGHSSHGHLLPTADGKSGLQIPVSDAGVGPHHHETPQPPLQKKTASGPWAARDTSATVLAVDQVVVGSLQGALGFGAPKESDPKTFSGDIIWERGIRGCSLAIPMLHPEAKIRLLWLFLGFFFTVYEAYAIPVYLAFDVTPAGHFWYFVSVINGYFILDIAIQFVTCYMDKQGSIVSNPYKVASMYAKTWLVLDVVAAIPWEWVDSPTGGAALSRMTRSIRLIRAARMLRLMRLMRVMKLKVFMDQIETHIEANYLFTFLTGVVRITGLLFAICHWGACVWYAIGTSDMYYEEHHDGAAASWVKVHQHDYPYIGEDKFQHYIFSLYFTLTTMTTVGYGDITPTNLTEVCFCMVLLCCSSVVFAGLMGTLTDMISALNNQRHELAEKKALLGRYMRWRAVPRRLKMTIRQHLLFLWDANKDYDTYEEEIKQRLPPVLKAELCNHIYGRILANAPFFAWMRDYPICTKYLAEKVQTMFLERGDCIFRMGQRNEQIYIMLTGEVVASRNESLFERDDDDNPEGAAKSAADPLSFDIPRQGDMTFSDVTAKVVRNQKAAIEAMGHKRKGAKDAPHQLQSSPTGPSKGHAGAEGTPKESFGVKSTGNAMFDSQVLTMATVELRRQDVRQTSAAKKVQRMWRKRMLYLNAAGEFSKTTHNGKGLKISRMTSKHVKAPAYFGESCLWQPLQDWQDPPIYMYTVRCECRGEIIYIPRQAVLDVIDRFSPWLAERHDTFREVVISQMQNMLQGDDLFRDWHRDFAMADLGAPRDDLGLQESHCMLLRRDTPQATFAGDEPAMPRVPLYQDNHFAPKVPNSLRRGNSGLNGTTSLGGGLLKKQRSSNGLGGPQERLMNDARGRV